MLDHLIDPDDESVITDYEEPPEESQKDLEEEERYWEMKFFKERREK